MKLRTIVLVAFLFAVVSGAFVYLDPLHVEPVTESEKVSMRLMPFTERGQIGLVEIQSASGGKTVFERVDGNWEVTYPVQAPVHGAVMESLITALRLSLKARRLEPEYGWDEYGLTDASLKVGIKTELNPNLRYLVVGNTSEVSDHIFARWEDEDDYFLLESQLKKIVEQTARAVERKKIFMLPMEDIEKIRIENAEAESYEIVLRDNGWLWMEPISILGSPIESEDVSQVKDWLDRIYIKEIVKATDENEDEFGFYLFGNSIKVVLKDGTEDVLYFGNLWQEKDAFYAKREDEQEYMLAVKKNVDAFFDGVKHLATKYELQMGG